MLLQPFLLAVAKKPTHWFIDGNNLLAHKGTAGDRHALTQKLLEIQDSAAEEIVLVFDGRKGEETSITQEGMIRLVELGEGLQSDDFIQDEIQKFVNDPVSRKKHRVNLVSADRDLRKKTSNLKPIVRTVVNPVTFWRRYLPRLKGAKGPNDNLPPENNV